MKKKWRKIKLNLDILFLKTNIGKFTNQKIRNKNIYLKKIKK